ncbi:occludin/ELL domain-containing protein 1 isoform X2 [Cuculus canorus]|uniref:occludin/ELL domain-containing protein 1 isoform X2 n=1 Tax=Cuculus canorus TaxID=55661 RepID=UPI0023AA9A18|nr:occludin/ELL domain-containing protein 1 isoform X2 [Cuculus canorus]
MRPSQSTQGCGCCSAPTPGTAQTGAGAGCGCVRVPRLPVRSPGMWVLLSTSPSQSPNPYRGRMRPSMATEQDGAWGGQGPHPAHAGPRAALRGGALLLMFNRRCLPRAAVPVSRGQRRPRDVRLRPTMRRAVGLSPEVGKRSSRRTHPRDPHHPKAAGSPRLPAPPGVEARGGLEAPGGPWKPHHRDHHQVVPPVPPGTAQGPHSLTPLPKAPPARARRVVFEDEVMPPGRPPWRIPPTKDGKKLGFRSIPPRLGPRPRAVPDYVVKYPEIQSPRQREGYKGVFQDQLAEYTELLGEVRAAWWRRGELEVAARRTDLALLAKQQRCRYLKKKLTHIKARIQEFDRAVHRCAVYF